jgi:hypothetical protein
VGKAHSPSPNPEREALGVIRNPVAGDEGQGESQKAANDDELRPDVREHVRRTRKRRTRRHLIALVLVVVVGFFLQTMNSQSSGGTQDERDATEQAEDATSETSRNSETTDGDEPRSAPSTGEEPYLTRVTVDSQMVQDITYLYFSPSDSRFWGVDVLGASRILSGGRSVSFFVRHPSQCNEFDVLAISETGTEYRRPDYPVCRGQRQHFGLSLSNMTVTGELNPHQVKTTFTNQTSTEIHYLYVSPRDSTIWGVDLLGTNPVLPSGETFSTHIPVNQALNVRAVGRSGQEYQFWIQIDDSSTQYRFVINRQYMQ